jgi:hypothetical protein
MNLTRKLTRQLTSKLTRSLNGDSAGGGGPIAYDYLIESDADWTTVFANNDAALAGKTIAVAPGNYTTKTLTSRNPASTVKIAALYRNQKPVIDKLVLSASNRLTFEDISFVSTTWSATPNGVVDIGGTCSNLTWRRCNIHGSYRGTVNPVFDVTTDNIPEYACIYPQFASDGTVSSLVISRDYVGDLVADGTHSITFTATSGYSFGTAPEATFTVSSGVITGTNITNAGASTYTNTINGSVGILSKICTWSGQRNMISWMSFGFRGVSPSNISNVTVDECNLDFLLHAFKPSGVTGEVTITDNYFDRIYADYVAIGCGQSNFPVTITDNFGTRPFSAAGDPSDPHSDFVQFFMNDISEPYTPQDWTDVVIERNVFVDGNARGGIQGMIIADSPADISFSRWRIVGNHISSRYLGMGINMVTPRDCYIAHNTMIYTDPTNSTDNTTARYITLSRTLDPPHGGPMAFGNSLIVNNIAESITRGVPDNTKIKLDGNVVMGLRGATIPYADVFSDHTATRQTLSQAIAAYTPKAGYAGKGAFGASYINHTGRTTDRTQEPSYVAFAPLLGQDPSTVVTSEWSCVIAGDDGRAISISGGEYRVADDASGTNATSWGSTAGTVDVYQFVQCRHTSAATGSTETHTTLTIGSHSFDFVSTTESTASFSLVDNQATAYSTIARPGADETGLKKLLLVCRFKADVLTAGSNIVAHTGAAALRIWLPSTSTIRCQAIASTRVSLRPSFTQTTTGFVTHFISLDFSNTNANEGCFWATDADGVLLNSTPGSGGSFDTRTTAGSGTDYGAFEATLLTGLTNAIFATAGTIGLFAEADGGGTLLDGRMAFFWMDWGTSAYSLPDITDASVRNLWTADLIGANGQGPTGSTPKLYYTGNAAAWNAGFNNLGSITAALTKGAGTYVDA